jgi:hypothetical protein
MTSCAKSIVHNQGIYCSVPKRRRFKIRDIETRIPDDLKIDGLCLSSISFSKFGLVAVYEFNICPKAFQLHFELIASTAIQEGCGYRLSPVWSIGGNKRAACPDEFPGRLLPQGSHPFSNVCCRVHDAGVYVAGFLQTEQPGSMVRVIKNIGRCLVNRRHVIWSRDPVPVRMKLQDSKCKLSKP